MSDLTNGLRHIADDHPCCRETLQLTIDTIEQLETENADISHAYGVTRDVVKGLCEELANLKAENAALRADAERYRWIKRDNIGVHDVLELFMSYINCDLDKEIDQTRAKEAKP